MITVSAENAIKNKEGICFAKSHALAALLRSMLIPAGFCYQKVLIGDATDSGYALHGLNALYLDACGWFRIDPRGNKTRSSFCIFCNRREVSCPIRKKLGEIDCPQFYVNPLSSVSAVIKMLRIVILCFMNVLKRLTRNSCAESISLSCGDQPIYIHAENEVSYPFSK